MITSEQPLSVDGWLTNHDNNNNNNDNNNGAFIFSDRIKYNHCSLEQYHDERRRSILPGQGLTDSPK